MDFSSIPFVGQYLPAIALALVALYAAVQLLFQFLPSAKSAAERAGALSIIDTLARSQAGSLIYQMIDHDGDGKIDYKTGISIVDTVAQHLVSVGGDSFRDLGIKNPTADNPVVQAVARRRVEGELLASGVKPVEWSESRKEGWEE